MTYNQYSFYSKLSYSFQKNVNTTEKVSLPIIENINDNSELVWNITSNLLDHYWSVFYEKYGTNLQDLGTSLDESRLPYKEYLANAIKTIVSNQLHGLVTVDSCTDISSEDDQCWNISASVPPSTLLNCLRHTPWRIEHKDAMSSFIIYQIVCAVEELHLCGIPHLGLTLDNIYIDENLMVKLSLPRFDALAEKIQRFSPSNQTATDNPASESKNLKDVLWRWMIGEMSNLDYLLYLNELAGRSKSDPNNHPMIPWVTDFSQPYGGYRDLKISKFRINKGDEHLDKIYQAQKDELYHYDNSCPLGLNNATEVHKKPSNISKLRLSKQLQLLIETDGIVNEPVPSNPHHVSDILSELSYFAYMARVTPIEVLKKYYRSFYNPQEFRWDMAKMYAWSPDECIPQFFTDPSVFRSTHVDMPDICLPEWCKDPEEFVAYHREILESEQISAELNHWIDLVFGYKLLGDEAVDAKNVHRQLTEKSLSLTNNGLTVLFRKAHPKRLCCSKSLLNYFGPKRPKADYSTMMEPLSNEPLIWLPEDYDPCELVEYYKSYSVFIQDSCSTPAVELKHAKKQSMPVLKAALREDVVNLCCLIVELFNLDKLRSDYVLSQNSFDLRVDSCSLLFTEEPSRIPLSFRDTIENILIKSATKDVYIPNISELKRSPKWLTFDKCVMKIFDLIRHIESPHMDTVIAVKHFFLSQTEVSKFSNEIKAILTPHLVNLLNLDLTVYFDQMLDIVVCILHRFGLIAGRKLLIRDILPHIVKLYPKSKSLVTSKHALLYQRNFLNLLLIRIGMSAFLNNMVGLLVQMLVIGQHIFGSMKESSTPEIDIKQTENDCESLNDDGGNVQLGDDDGISQEGRKHGLDGNDEDSQSADFTLSAHDSDSVSQCGIENEEPKCQLPPTNGCIPNSLPNLLDYLPLIDQDVPDPSPPSTRNNNGSLSKLLTSPFKKLSRSKNVKKTTTKVEVRKHLSQDCSKMSLAQLSHSSLIWLSDLIGPIEASSKILYELLAQFSLCYQHCDFDNVPPENLEGSHCSLVTGTYDAFVEADRDVCSVLECLKDFIGLYGLAIVWHRIRHFLDTLLDKKTFVSDDLLPNTLTGFVCSLSLLKFLSMLIPNEYLDNFLSEKVLDEYLPLIIRTIGNMSQPFPSGKRPRQVLLHKVIDLIYLLSSRLKFDQIKDSMNNIYKLLFGLFNKTFDCNEQGSIIYREVPIEMIESTDSKEKDTPCFFVNFLPGNSDFTILTKKSDLREEVPLRNHPYRTISTSNRELAFEEIKCVITAELAYVLYISFAKLMGQNKLDSLICNQSLIQALMSHHERNLPNAVYSIPDKAKQQKLEEILNLQTKTVMLYNRRHLTGTWKEYWVHELGFCDSEPFDIKQMCLGKFEGHNGAVKGFDVLNCENGFLSYAKDKIVKIYSIADIDYDNLSTEVSSRFSYIHQKPVSEAIYLEQMRMAVSLDGIVHLWDPFIGKSVLNSSLGVASPNWSVVCSIPPSQSQIAVANGDGRVHVVDIRSGSSSYSYHLTTGSIPSPATNDVASNTGGLIRKIASTPDGNQLIVGNSEGFLNLIDLRMSKLMNAWRSHQGEISQIVLMNNWCASSSTEPVGRVSLTNLSNFNQNLTVIGPDLGSIHSLMVLRDQLIVSASQNRFGLFQSLNQYKSLNRLSPSLYKGTVSTASLLLHNRLLLLGNDTGAISLWY